MFWRGVCTKLKDSNWPELTRELKSTAELTLVPSIFIDDTCRNFSGLMSVIAAALLTLLKSIVSGVFSTI